MWLKYVGRKTRFGWDVPIGCGLRYWTGGTLAGGGIG
jgi:hypothetical protein